MGWTPTRTTYASEGFHDLYALAIKLIKAGNAYVCFQKSEEIEVCLGNRNCARQIHDFTMTVVLIKSRR